MILNVCFSTRLMVDRLHRFPIRPASSSSKYSLVDLRDNLDEVGQPVAVVHGIVDDAEPEPSPESLHGSEQAGSPNQFDDDDFALAGDPELPFPPNVQPGLELLQNEPLVQPPENGIEQHLARSDEGYPLQQAPHLSQLVPRAPSDLEPATSVTATLDTTVTTRLPDVPGHSSVSACPYEIKLGRRGSCVVVLISSLEHSESCGALATIRSAPLANWYINHEGLLGASEKTIAQLQREHPSLTYQQARRTRIAIRQMDPLGSPASIQLLEPLLLRFCEVNPNSITRTKYTVGRTHRYSFLCPGVRRNVLEFSKPVVQVDATFLKCHLNYRLLVAVVQDGNRTVHPIAFALYAGAEDEACWSLFFEDLLKSFPCLGERGHLFSVMSDRHKGLLRARENIIPHIPHYACTVHLKNNAKAVYAAFDKLGFYAAARTYSRSTCYEFLSKQKDCLGSSGDQVIYDLLTVNCPTFSWAVCDASTPRFGIVSSQAIESFNNVLVEARKHQPAYIVNWFIQYFAKRPALMQDSSEVLSKDGIELWQALVESSHLQTLYVQRFNDHQYQVHDAERAFTVCLQQHQCDCRHAYHRQFPCAHIFKVLQTTTKQKNPRSAAIPFMHQSYLQSSVKQMHAYEIKSPGDIGHLRRQADVAIPVLTKSISGKRIKSKGEESQKSRSRKPSRAAQTELGDDDDFTENSFKSKRTKNAPKICSNCLVAHRGSCDSSRLPHQVWFSSLMILT
jgi:hypothetical protein